MSPYPFVIPYGPYRNLGNRAEIAGGQVVYHIPKAFRLFFLSFLMSAESSKCCVACGWTLEQQENCAYSSHLKLFYGAGKRGTWSIGSDVILKERPDEGPKTEVTTLKHLAAYPDIPVPKILRDWVDGNGQYFVLLERIQGQTLEQAWSSLSDTQKIAIADECIGIRKQLRLVSTYRKC